MRYVDLVIPCKNPDEKFPSTVRLWLGQKLPYGWAINIIIVNDGSSEFFLSDGVRQTKEITILNNNVSQGRAIARNQGAGAGSGEIIVFVDADCVPLKDDVIHAYILALENCDLGVGSLTACGEDFWAKYFRKIAKDRERELYCKNPMAFTAANFAISRVVFDRVQGFDECYKSYGLEDKDLIARLINIDIEVVFIDEARLEHFGDANLRQIAEKIYEAGRDSSIIFMGRHFERYKKMSYYKADVRVSVVARILISLFGCLGGGVLSMSSRVIDMDCRWVSFAVKYWVVKACMAFYYAKGTSDKRAEF